MSGQYDESPSGPVKNTPEIPGTATLVLIIVWLTASAVLVTMLLMGYRGRDQFGEMLYVLQVGYVAVLLWYLYCTGPSIRKLPVFKPFLPAKWRFAKFIPALAMLVIAVLHGVPDLGENILFLVIMISALVIPVAWYRKIRWRVVFYGISVTLIALFSGYPLVNNYISKFGFIILLAFVPPMFISSWLLFRRTDFGEIKLLSGGYFKAVKSFLMGCLMFVPLGLINAADDAPGTGMKWIDEWWEPLVQPLFSGIVEETWYRLFLVSFCYYLLRPLFPKKPVAAVVLVLLFSAVTFGLGHGTSLDRLLTTGLLFGLPMAVVFARRDWEHTVGAHYMINLIPTIIYYLES